MLRFFKYLIHVWLNTCKEIQIILPNAFLSLFLKTDFMRINGYDSQSETQRLEILLIPKSEIECRGIQNY